MTAISFEVDTPNLAFNIQRTGEYRIDVNADGNETDATVWQGRGEATGGGESYVVVAGQRARFTGTDQLDHEIEQIPRIRRFRQLGLQPRSARRSQRVGATISRRDDRLRRSRRLRPLALCGRLRPVWTPAGVAADWAPYRYGHWVWVAPWGWTWVEDEPWGFAPFHYGRWAFCAESLVLGAGTGVRAAGVRAGAGGVRGRRRILACGRSRRRRAWPGFRWVRGEVYVPWYRTSRGYVNNVNITNTRVNVTQVTNVYNVYNSRTTQCDPHHLRQPACVRR